VIFDIFKGQSKIKFKTKLIASLVIILVAVIVYIAIDFKFQLMQYKELGEQYLNVLYINVIASIIAMLVSFCFIFICIIITNVIIIKKLKLFFIEENLKPIKLPNYTLAFIIAIIGAFITKDFLYQHALVLLKANMFYIHDPIFGKDYGYYLFQRPCLIALTNYLSGTWLVIILYTFAYYILSFGVIFNAVAIESVKKYGVYTHNVINIGIFFIIKAATYWLAAENILYSRNGNVFGASFTDIHVWLKIYTLAPFVLSAIVVLSIIFFLRNKPKKAIITIAAFPAFWILGFIAASLVQLILVIPNEITQEKNYIKNNIENTRYAYNLSDKLNEKKFYVNDSLTTEMLDKNKDIIENVRITDYETTLEAQKQLQTIREYYKFTDTDVSVYNIGGKPTVVLAAARELDKSNLDEKIYVNTRFKYTHGYGMVMSPINKVDNQGLPNFIIKNIPSISSEGAPEIKN